MCDTPAQSIYQAWHVPWISQEAHVHRWVCEAVNNLIASLYTCFVSSSVTLPGIKCVLPMHHLHWVQRPLTLWIHRWALAAGNDLFFDEPNMFNVHVELKILKRAINGSPFLERLNQLTRETCRENNKPSKKKKEALFLLRSNNGSIYCKVLVRVKNSYRPQKPWSKHSESSLI